MVPLEALFIAEIVLLLLVGRLMGEGSLRPDARQNQRGPLCIRLALASRCALGNNSTSWTFLLISWITK
jgi:hypothetical protein